MSQIERIRAAVYRTIEAVNELLPEEQALKASDQLALLGKNAKLDSMGFVNFVVALEQELEQELGLGIDMADLINVQDGEDQTIATIGDLIDSLSKRFQ